MKLLKKKQKQLQQIFNEKDAICKTKNSYILVTFLLITIAMLIAINSCYLINYKAKQKDLLPSYVTNNELKQVLY